MLWLVTASPWQHAVLPGSNSLVLLFSGLAEEVEGTRALVVRAVLHAGMALRGCAALQVVEWVANEPRYQSFEEEAKQWLWCSPAYCSPAC